MKFRSLAAATLALIALITTATVALGHAELIASDPPDGGTLATTPYTMTLTFDETLEPNSNVLIRDSTGAEVARGGVSEADAAVLEVELPELPDGDYIARWTASTADGHSERGTVSFTIEAAAAPTASPSPSPSATPSATPAATSASPAPAASPASPAPVEPVPGPTSSNDLLIALLVAAVAIAGVVGFLLVRGRR